MDTLSKTNKGEIKNAPHSLYIGDKIIIKGALGVIEYTDKEALIKISEGIILLNGNNLNVEKVDLECFEIILSGKVSLVKYQKTVDKMSIIKRIFK